jgi:streptogramin lyase
MEKKLVTAVVLVAIVGVAGFAAYYFILQPTGPCMPLGGTKMLRSVTSSSEFDALTEYRLPSPSRWANAITVAQDGSVWFGEQSVPGVGHLFANGTLVEYPWPSASHPTSKSCGFETSIWGVVIWNGMVWGCDADENAIVGINPQTGAARVINVTGAAGFPYTLSIAPDGSLWFTSLADAAVLGRVGLDYSVTAMHVNGIGGEFPAQLDFVNSSYAYMVALDRYNSSGGLYFFNPGGASSSVSPQRLGANFRLQAPDSVAAGAGTVWVAQHGPSSLAAFDVVSGGWTLFPTTHLASNITTLPYFVSYGPGGVWFNEHYGNRIGFIGQGKQTMTEYSESNPPVTNESDIGNDLTIAPAQGGVWFTSTTGNYIGFANSSYVPSFSVSVAGGNSASIHTGGQVGLNCTVSGSWKSSLSVVVSDSENYTAAPSSITMTPSSRTLQAGSGPFQLQVQVGVSSKLAPGEYTLAVTVSDGLVLRTAFVFLDVS